MENKKTVLVITNKKEYDKYFESVKDDYRFLLAHSPNEALEILNSGEFISLIQVLDDISLSSLRNFLRDKKENPDIISIPVLIASEQEPELSIYKMGITDMVNADGFINLKERYAHIIELVEKKKIIPYTDNTDYVLPAVRINNLYKSYGPKEVLKGLDLEVYNGELFGFIGRNGIGKSTTIDCMIGVKQFNSGSIEIEGYSIVKEPLLVKSRFGYVASEPTCYESMTGYEYLEFIASIYRISEGEFVNNVEYLSKRLVLSDDDLDKSISAYSHGMKQKLCLIASLLNNPDVWILDEPTVGLDIMAVEELKKMMREYANHGKCVFITSHNIDIIAKICDRVAIINDGKVVELMDLNKDPNKRLQLPRIFLNIFGAN